MNKWTPEQQMAICESGKNIIVSAGAGSGKTAVLTQRVIKKIQDGIHINELLILTFTRAAANEMKDRIRDELSKSSKFEKELELLNSSYVTTFDSFALSVVKKYHYLLNIPKTISISDDAIVRIKQKQIIDNLFEKLYQKDSEDFKDLIEKYCIKNDNALRKLILKISTTIDGFVDKEEFVNKIQNNFYKNENINKLLDEYYDFLNEKRKLILLEFDNLKYYFDEEYLLKVKKSINSIINNDIQELYLISKISLPNVPRNTSPEGKEAKKAFKSVVDELISFSKYGNAEKVKESILSTNKQVNTILNIVKEYIEKLSNYKKEEQIYTFNDIAFYAIKIVKENKNAREELKNKFKEIMIDEYQDTNDIQDIFISYIENNNVYMVGDIKQSIYRFRGSNPNLFKLKYDNYSKNNGGIKIDLIKNFRSRDEVLSGINNIFELIMDYNLGGAKYKESHEMIYGNKIYEEMKSPNFDYKIEILEYENNTDKKFSDDEIEIFAIANDIKNKMKSNMKIFDKKTNKLRDINYNDFVIICDRGKYFTKFKKIFEYVELPLSILREDDLSINVDLYIIKNIIDLIIRINSNDYGIEYKYDILSIGRSFLYELNDEYLFDVITNNKLKDNVIYNDFSKIKSINSKTSTMILEEILNITDFYNKIYKIGEYENINLRLKTIYELSYSLSSIGYDLVKFRDYLDNIINDGINIKYNSYLSNSESIKILTIHKSKGLEYPICYFADLNHGFNYKDANEKIIVDRKYGIIIPDQLEENSITPLKEIFKNNYVKEEISEKIRLFYVALTRAREKIIIVLPYKNTIKCEKDDTGVINEIRRSRFNKLSDFVYAIKDYLNEYFSSIDLTKIGLSKNYLYAKEIKNEINYINNNIEVKEISINNTIEEELHFSKEENLLMDKKTKNNMEYGTLLHEIFELIDLKQFNDELIKDNFINKKIKLFLENDLFKNIKNSNIYHEYEFEYKKNNILYHGVIDLMLEYNDYIDIVDFKLKNTLDKAYKRQLKGYKTYIQSISNKKVNLYLYSIIDGKIIKVNI